MDGILPQPRYPAEGLGLLVLSFGDSPLTLSSVVLRHFSLLPQCQPPRFLHSTLLLLLLSLSVACYYFTPLNHPRLEYRFARIVVDVFSTTATIASLTPLLVPANVRTLFI
uniref:Uncharacterized protein n=1 Tax=Trypanosoma vivax (strain Y486) TaxID=1055687 RepID=G0UC19_TRYVY|nr:hypothetical protein TVY486_1108510 [Trypanosoma vivax Y486]